MRIDAYAIHASGEVPVLLVEGISSISFGTVGLGNLSGPIILKPVITSENIIYTLQLLWNNEGELDPNKTVFQYAVTEGNEVPESYTDFILFPSKTAVVQDSGIGYATINIEEGKPTSYVWIRSSVGSDETIGSTSDLNFRFVFDYTPE